MNLSSKTRKRLLEILARSEAVDDSKQVEEIATAIIRFVLLKELQAAEKHDAR